MNLSAFSKFDYFLDGVLRFRPPATAEENRLAEEQLGIKLSPHYKTFVQTYNGGRIIEVHSHGVQSTQRIKVSPGCDIVSINLDNWAHEWWPKTWLEIGTDGFGNYFVADIGSKDVNGEYLIVLVDHDKIDAKIAPPPYADSYDNFLVKVTDEMARLYTPEGHLKSNIFHHEKEKLISTNSSWISTNVVRLGTLIGSSKGARSVTKRELI